jgi:hypothetical protein
MPETGHLHPVLMSVPIGLRASIPAQRSIGADGFVRDRTARAEAMPRT